MKIEAFPKLQFLGKQPWIYGKKRASGRFFKSLPQNQPGFGKGSIYREIWRWAFFRYVGEQDAKFRRP
jgi:hypothetical protein